MDQPMEAEDFLELLWGDTEGWVDLPAKVGQYWVPYPLQWPPSEDITVSRRIDQSLLDEEDLYYSVAQFAKRGRAIEDVLPVGWLWADLDEVHPSVATGMGLMPTVAVESSPGRFQALWKLRARMKPAVIERLNQALTYALGADKGGWDLTQVLRIPGTRNFKYPGAPRVQMLWYEAGLVYRARDVLAVVKEHVPADELRGATTMVLPKKPIPRKAKQLLWAKESEVVQGERSDRLWELNCLLAESGLDEQEIMVYVWPCAWNKWRGQRSGRERLASDIRKAVVHVRRKAVRAKPPPEEKEEEKDGRLSFVSFPSFAAMKMEEPKWMIEDIWTAGSHGIIGGEPKTSKTTLALALGLSVASGRDFLGKYPCGDSGPVLFVQEENAPWLMQDRIRKLSLQMGIISKKDANVMRLLSQGALGRDVTELYRPPDIPFWILNNYGFDLSVEEHRDMLEGHVQEVKPKLIVLDPLYLIFGPINANEMGQLQPFLKWVVQLRYRYGCAVLIVHHMGKRNEATAGRRAGQRLIGSATLHGFTDSALYTSAMQDPRDGWTKVLLEREFRSMEPQKPVELAWHFDSPGSLGMQLELAHQDLEGKIADVVRQQSGVTVASLARELELDKRTILARVRGGDLMVVRGGGPGKAHRIYMAHDTNGAQPA